MATNPFDSIPVEEAPATAVAEPNPFDSIPIAAEAQANPFDSIPTGDSSPSDLLSPAAPSEPDFLRKSVGLRTISVPNPKKITNLRPVPDPNKSLLGLTPEKVMTGREMADATGISPKITVPVSAIAKTAAGLGEFLTSPEGIGETALSAIPVYLHQPILLLSQPVLRALNDLVLLP